MKNICENVLYISVKNEEAVNKILAFLSENGIDDVVAGLTKNRATFRFPSKNCPPLGVFEKLAGQGFAAKALFHMPFQNEVGEWNPYEKDEFFTYNFDDPFWAEEIPSQLVEEFDLFILFREWEESEKELDVF